MIVCNVHYDFKGIYNQGHSLSVTFPVISLGDINYFTPDFSLFELLSFNDPVLHLL